MSETEDQTLQRICEEVEAEMGYKVFGFSSPDEVTADFAKAVARRYAATVGAGVPDGWKLVPVQPGRAQIDAVGKQVDDFSRDHARLFARDIYAAFLAEAPAPPSP